MIDTTVFCTPPIHAQTGPTPLSDGQFTLYSARDLENLPEIAWLVDGILPRTGLAAIFAPSGLGKSFLCLDLAAHMATGWPWFGHMILELEKGGMPISLPDQDQTSAVPTMSNHARMGLRTYILALEGWAGLRQRSCAWGRHYGIAFPDGVHFVNGRFDLTQAEDVANLGRLINETGGADLVIIDTLNRAAHGADENSGADMGRLISGATYLQEMADCLILLVHHAGKDLARGLRGHSSLHAALDAVIEVRRDGMRNAWELVKSKDGQDGIRHAFELQVVELGFNQAGSKISSCVVVECEGAVIQPKQVEPSGANQRVILSYFKDLWLERKMTWSATGQDWHEGIPFNDAVDELKEKLLSVDSNHRQQRAKESLERLCQMGFLHRRGDLLTLPPAQTVTP